MILPGTARWRALQRDGGGARRGWTVCRSANNILGNAMRYRLPVGVNRLAIVPPHIRNTPNCARSPTGAFSVADSASPSTSRVCTGSITPSSQSRAVA